MKKIFNLCRHVGSPVIVALSFFCLGTISGSAQSAEALYNQGKEAFEKRDYLSATKHLFAFKNSAPPDVWRQVGTLVDGALAYSDEQIDVALKTKQQLDKYGRVTQITTTGKFDVPGEKGKTHSVSLPSPPTSKKPALPARLPERARVDPANIPRQATNVEPATNTSEVGRLRSENEALRRKIDAARTVR